MCLSMNAKLPKHGCFTLHTCLSKLLKLRRYYHWTKVYSFPQCTMFWFRRHTTAMVTLWCTGIGSSFNVYISIMANRFKFHVVNRNTLNTHQKRYIAIFKISENPRQKPDFEIGKEEMKSGGTFYKDIYI